jgi:hypothetical protein
MIVELGPPEPRESPRSWFLPVGLAALFLYAFGTMTQPAPVVAPLELPAAPRVSVLGAAAPAPATLDFPASVARRTGRGVGSVTGLPSSSVMQSQETWWQFRLSDGRDARLARAPRGESFILAPENREVSVRATRARGFTTRFGAAVVWTEEGRTYQLSSRTLSLDEIIRLADTLVGN